ncbi:MAG: type II toxin-antitoxin system VapC family toxin [Acidobacteria bacterium]|nr:type II toxin-antitoxin system VapC family toxin [Acidobacteriota bacterium]
MKTSPAFWDSSAIVLLCCHQANSPKARLYARNFPRLVAWWASNVEVTSALERLRRENLISQDILDQSLSSLALLQNSWVEVLPIEQVRDLAQSLLTQHPLRAADSLQLASALVWCKLKPKNRPFICFDDRLSNIALSLGFDIYT